MSVHEQGTVELIGNALQIGLFQDELTDVLPMVATFPVRGQRQQLIPRVLNCAQDGTALDRQRVCQLLRQVGGAEECPGRLLPDTVKSCAGWSLPQASFMCLDFGG